MARRAPAAILPVVVSLLTVAPLLAQDQTDDWYLDKPIVSVRFVGLRHVAEIDLRPIVQPYLDRPFTLDLFWELQGKLYATDLFASLESNAVAPDDERSAVIVEFVAQERPLVGAIAVTGNRGLRRTEILEVMSLAGGDVFDPITLNADTAAVVALYADKGYPDAAVNMVTVTDEAAGEVAVTVEISEGSSVSVEQILFVGNDFASDSTLRGRMLTKQRSLFESGAFREAALQEDRQIIQAYYASHGYVDARVERIERDLRLDEEQGRRSLVLTVHVNEGEQYTYGGMLFEGNEVFSTEELTRLVRHGADREVNRDVVEADFLRIQDHYFENGYIFNVIELTEERDEQARSISFRLTIRETDRAHIENIILSGNEKTRDHVLLRELPFEVGDVFNKTEILQGLRNLYNTQYFSAVTPETPPGSAAGLMDVVVTVEEQSTADINFGLTIGGSDFPFAASVRWNERNLAGGGQTVGAALELSPIKQSLTFEFIEPWLFGARWSGGVNLGVERAVVRSVMQDILPPIFGDPATAAPDPYLTREEWEAADRESVSRRYSMEYTEWDVSIGLTSGYRIPTSWGFVRFSGGLSSSLRFLTYDTAIYRPFEKTIRDERESWVIVNRLDAGVAWDTRDFFLNPSEGFLLSQGASLTGGLLHGARHFIRLNSRADGFLTLVKEPVFSNWDLQVVLGFHSGFAAILPQFWWPAEFDDGLVIDSATDLLVLDGIRVARGWDPVRGGRARWENSVELRVPIDPRVLWAVTFLDAAVLWPEPEDIEGTELGDVHFSLGAGFRFSIPQFPVRLYFANTFRIVDAPEGPEDTLDLFQLEEWKFVISLGGDVF
jgi:outer membrane protein insertion porin family